MTEIERDSKLFSISCGDIYNPIDTEGLIIMPVSNSYRLFSNQRNSARLGELLTNEFLIEAHNQSSSYNLGETNIQVLRDNRNIMFTICDTEWPVEGFQNTNFMKIGIKSAIKSAGEKGFSKVIIAPITHFTNFEYGFQENWVKFFEIMEEVVKESLNNEITLPDIKILIPPEHFFYIRSQVELSGSDDMKNQFSKVLS